MKLLAKVCRAIDKISIFTGKTASWLGLALVGVTGFEVLMRYGFNSPTSWAMELGTFLFTGMWLFSGNWTHQADAHIKVDILYNKLSKRGRAIMDAVTGPLAIFFIVVVVWRLIESGLYSIHINEHSFSQWSPPIYIVKMVLPVGAVLLGLQIFAEVIRDFYLAITGRELK